MISGPVYRGGAGQIVSLLHKLTGLGVFAFLVLHILDTAALAYSAELYNKIMGVYRHPFFKAGEVGLTGAVIFHAFNGIRVIALDIWTWLIPHHRTLIWIETAALFLLWVPTSMLILLGHH
ncbi:MAG: succinate dehydrogenase, cytochrome b556 subunit [Elusimicrobia bacterium]|nr:succinate dehydrogenase, cytochrome b556 subunit [Elusimicrobiota bacterium]